MPRLSDLWSEVSRQRQDVEFLAVDIGDSPDVIRDWWSKREFKLRAVMQDGQSVSQAFGVHAYPTNYVIGPDGKVVSGGIGFDEAMIRSALASTQPGQHPSG